MKIGIISDIHGYPHIFERAMEHFKDCSIILSAGDVLYHGPRNPILEGYNPKLLSKLISESKVPFLTAKGNCDCDVDSTIIGIPFMEYVFYEVDGVRFIVNHGDKLSEEKLIDMAKYYRADVVIRGHSHIRENKKIDGVLYINPGSPSLPKNNNPKSIGIYENGNVEFIDLD